MNHNPAIGKFRSVTAWPKLAHIFGSLFVVASVINVLGVSWTKPLLMPFLAAWALFVMPQHNLNRSVRTLLLIALFFSWLGDMALMGTGDIWFIAGLSAFALAQVTYIAMFSQIPGISLVRAWKFVVIPYIGFWLAMNMVIAPGNMRLPVVIYSALLIAMALSALNTALKLNSPWRFAPAIGALSFTVSDSLIALQEFNNATVVPGVIMATYVVGQALIVSGVILGHKSTFTPPHSPTRGASDQ
jgi:uncharacterized membrane protein YhhN